MEKENKKDTAPKKEEVQTKTLYILTVSFLALLFAVLTVLLVLRKPAPTPGGGTTASSNVTATNDSTDSDGEDQNNTQDDAQGNTTQDNTTQDNTAGEQPGVVLPEDPVTPEIPGLTFGNGDNALPPVLPPDWME